MRRTVHKSAVFLLAALAGCTSPPDVPTQDQHATLHCDDGRTVQVHFLNNRAVLESGGISVAMVQRRAASGIWYAGDGQQLRGKGYDLTWTGRDGKAHACRDERAGPR